MVMAHLPTQLPTDLSGLSMSQKMDKLKASDKLSFPLELDLAGVLASVTLDNIKEEQQVGSSYQNIGPP